MFEQSMLDKSATKRSWAVLVSFGLQCGLIAIALIIPLLNYYEIPLTELSSFVVAPPPPPPPPPPPVEIVKQQKIVPKQFESGVLTQPKVIPDKVAIIEDQETPQGISGVVGGVGVGGGSLGGVLGGIISSTPSVAPPPPPPPPAKVVQRISVGGSVQQARMLRRVNPVYPPLARSNRIQGTVQLSAIIGKDGTIQELQVIDGHPMLIQSALSAVKQWQYKPTMLNDQPVEVATQINVVFTLGR